MELVGRIYSLEAAQFKAQDTPNLLLAGADF